MKQEKVVLKRIWRETYRTKSLCWQFLWDSWIWYENEAEEEKKERKGKADKNNSSDESDIELDDEGFFKLQKQGVSVKNLKEWTEKD